MNKGMTQIIADLKAGSSSRSFLFVLLLELINGVFPSSMGINTPFFLQSLAARWDSGSLKLSVRDGSSLLRSGDGENATMTVSGESSSDSLKLEYLGVDNDESSVGEYCSVP